MLLRHHPLMSYQGLPSWPPVWVWTEGVEKKEAQGEVGVLKAAEQSNIRPANRCFLHIDHEASSYIGCLLMDDSVFCEQITKLLQDCCNRPLVEIGGLDLP